MPAADLASVLREIVAGARDPRLLASDGLIDEFAKLSGDQKMDGMLLSRSSRAFSEVIVERGRILAAVGRAYEAIRRSVGLETYDYFELWNSHIPLAQYLSEVRHGRRLAECFTVAITGGPGAGKTTLGIILEVIFAKGMRLQPVRISSDDFYLSREARLKRGYLWRGPETLDVGLAKQVLSDVKAGKSLIDVPRFDLGSDQRSHIERVAGPFSLCLLEGWMVGKLMSDCFGSIRAVADYVIFVEADIEFLRAARFRKEAAVRLSTGGTKGLSDQQMSLFWSETIRPGIDRFTLPYRDEADLVIRVDAGHQFVDIDKRHP
jgi:uridine kinase